MQLAALYLELGDWNAVRDKVISENLLQTRTLNTLKRVCREVVSRLKTLSAGELDFLVAANHQEQSYLLWLAICRRYRFIAQAKAKETVAALKGRLCGMAEFSALSGEQQEQITRPFNEFTTAIERQKLIAVSRDTLRRFEESDYPQLLAQLSGKWIVGSKINRNRVASRRRLSTGHYPLAEGPLQHCLAGRRNRCRSLPGIHARGTVGRIPPRQKDSDLETTNGNE